MLALAALVLLAVAPLAAAGQHSHQRSDAVSSKPQAAEAAAIKPDAPTITFLKIFKSSSPSYVKIQLDRQGAGTYDIRQLPDRPRPQPFQISPALAAKIFSLARRLHDFDGIQLETRRRIANLGEKTFLYEKAGTSYQVSFNYTLNSTANDLLTIFEGLSLQDQYIEQLRSSMRYDPLGLYQVLVRLGRDVQAGQLADPAALTPLLNKIAADKNLLDIARDRASAIVASFHHGK
jgi:hypothetical protein